MQLPYNFRASLPFLRPIRTCRKRRAIRQICSSYFGVHYDSDHPRRRRRHRNSIIIYRTPSGKDVGLDRRMDGWVAPSRANYTNAHLCLHVDCRLVVSNFRGVHDESNFPRHTTNHRCQNSDYVWVRACNFVCIGCVNTAVRFFAIWGGFPETFLRGTEGQTAMDAFPECNTR